MSDEFVYDRMTPELRAFLDFEPHPHYKFASDPVTGVRSLTPTPESVIAVDTWQAARNALLDKTTPGEAQAYYEARKVWACRDETQTGLQKKFLSIGGKYALVITNHDTGTGWQYSRGRVYAGENLIATICRNYTHFPFAFVLGHSKTGHDYLVCGTDYQGQTVIELTTGNRVDYIPEKGGFCWTEPFPNPSGTILAVPGCFWGGPYTVRFFDFSNPMSLPHPLIAEDQNADDVNHPWIDDSSCVVGYRRDYVDLPGHRLHDKCETEVCDGPEEDLDEIEAEAKRRGQENEGWVSRLRGHLWVLPA